MSQSLLIVSYSLLFLLLFSFFLFGFIVVRRVILQCQNRIFQKRYHQVEADLLEAMSSLRPAFSLEVARKYKSWPAVLTKALLDYGNAITGEGKDQLMIIFNEALRHRCYKNLSSRRTVKRLQGARLFIVFFDPAESSLLLKLLRDKPIVKLAAITALSRTPSPQMLRYLFKAFGEDSGQAARTYFNIMFGLGGRIEPLVKSNLKKPLPSEKLGLLIELVGSIPLRALYEDILVLASHEDKEIRIKVARALGKLLFPESAPTLVRLSSDPAWEVQAQAVKSLGSLKNLETVDLLARSLYSPHWYVRYNAGNALAGIGEEGIRKLKEIAAQKEDRYAGDMATMALNEVIYLEEAA